MRFGKDDEFGHVRYTDDLTIHLSGEVHRLLYLPAVDQPESDEENMGYNGAFVSFNQVWHICPKYTSVLTRTLA